MIRKTICLIGLVYMGLSLVSAGVLSGQSKGVLRLTWPDGSSVLVPSDRAMEVVLREHMEEPDPLLPGGFVMIGPVREIRGANLSVEVALSYAGMIAEQAGSVDRLQMFRLDEGRGSWISLNGTIRTEDRCVMARSDRVGMFALGLAKAAFADVRIYPNPFKPNDGDTDTGSCAGGVITGITIDGLPPKIKSIEIYDVSGMLVATMGRAIVYDVVRDEATWTCINDDGEEVVSGIYVLAMEAEDGEQRTVKIGVIK